MNTQYAVPNSWPWTVTIGYFGPDATYTHSCAGSLISKRFVIVAYDCFKRF